MKLSKIIYSPIIPLTVASAIFFGAALYVTIAVRHEKTAARERAAALEVFHNEIYTLTQEGKYPEAIAKAEEAIRLDPNYVETWVDKGMTLYLSGDCAGATAALYHAVNLDPKDESVGNMLDMMLSSCGGENDTA